MTVLLSQTGRLALENRNEGFTLFVGILLYLSALQVTYFHLRNGDVFLYFASYLTFKKALFGQSVALTFMLILPLFLICKKSKSDLFALLIAPLVVIGGASGSVALAYHELSTAMLFYGLYVLLPTLLLFVRPPSIRILNGQPQKVRGRIMISLGVIGMVIFSYLAWKYKTLLGVPGLGEVYEYRSAFEAVVSPWERYAVTFGKLVGAFCLAAYAVATRRRLVLLGSIFILSIDYGLAGHKASLAFIMIIGASYFCFSVLGWRYRPSYLVIPLLVCLAGINGYLWSGASSPQAILIYDRTFNVTGGLFVRYFDFANLFGFFNGGPGLLGKFFNGRDQNYYELVGEYFFSKGVSANADIISDAYINFGGLGSIISLVVLRLLFSERDNAIYVRSREPVVVLMIPYSIALFSMGLQTALLTGGLMFGVFLVKARAIPTAQPSPDLTVRLS